MSGESINLSIKTENSFGQKVYVENTAGVSFQTLDQNEFWTVESPSETLKSLTSLKTRKYGDVEFLMSAKASEHISEFGQGGGSVVVVRFNWGGRPYFIITGDNKKYLMNSGGEKRTGESHEETAIRQVSEELKITLDEKELEPLAAWEFTYRNNLVGLVSWDKRAVCFQVNLEINRVEHLLPDRADKLNVMCAKDYKFKLDKTQMVVIFAGAEIDSLPELIEGKRFDGHHKKLIYMSLGLNDDIDVSYLIKFEKFKKV